MTSHEVELAIKQLKVGRIYQHFKGNLYLLTSISKDAETNHIMCEYTALYGKCHKYTRQARHFVSDKDKHGNLIADRKENITWQKTCFRLVGDEYGTELKKIRT